jgi:hypothetical protein
MRKIGIPGKYKNCCKAFEKTNLYLKLVDPREKERERKLFHKYKK